MRTALVLFSIATILLMGNHRSQPGDQTSEFKPLMLGLVSNELRGRFALAGLKAPYRAQIKKVGQGLRFEFPALEECASDDFDNYGHPLMFEEGNGILFGLSVGNKRVVYPHHAPFYLWIVNHSSKPQVTTSCETDWFMHEAFDVFDASGDRVPSVSEQNDSQYRDKQAPPRTSRPPVCRFNYVCDANMMIQLPPHACLHWANFGKLYALKPGEYSVLPRETLACSPPQWERLETKQPVKPPDGQLSISVTAH